MRSWFCAEQNVIEDKFVFRSAVIHMAGLAGLSPCIGLRNPCPSSWRLSNFLKRIEKTGFMAWIALAGILFLFFQKRS
jgi:hypothetical protein